MNLRQLREACSVSAIEMARRLGMTPAGLYALEAVGNPKVSALRRYVEALGGQVEITIIPPNGPVSE